MTDRVIIPVPGIGLLALTREALAEALAAGAELTGQQPSPASAATGELLLDADQAGAQLGVTARWLDDSARAGIIPHYKLGAYRRFRVSEVAQHCRMKGAEMPRPTDHQSVRPKNRFMAQ
jgi:hypothetical protein